MILIYPWQTLFEINEIKSCIRKLQKLAMNCFAIAWLKYISFLKKGLFVFHKNLWKNIRHDDLVHELIVSSSVCGTKYNIGFFVCVCVFIPFHLLASSGCTMSVTIRERVGSTIFCCGYSLGASAKSHHLSIWTYFISPPKMKTPVRSILKRRRMI